MNLSPASIERLWKYVNQNPDYPGVKPGCWPWEGTVDKRCKPVFYAENRRFTPARLVYELITCEKPHTSLYKVCGDPMCVNPEHMLIGKKIVKGRLEDDDIYDIKNQMINAYKPGLGKNLAKKYAISPAMVYNIANSISYQHVHVPNENRKVDRRTKGLSQYQREEIKRKHKAGGRGIGAKLAREYGVTPARITQIVRED
jgi:hypothetical protein